MMDSSGMARCVDDGVVINRGAFRKRSDEFLINNGII